MTTLEDDMPRAQIEALANEHLEGPMQALKAKGLTVVCLVAPTKDPADGRAVVAASCDSFAQAVDVLFQALKQMRKTLGLS